MGSRDAAVCGHLATDRSSSATPHAAEAGCFRVPPRTDVVPGYGHSINLAPNARDYCSAVSSWDLEEVGR
ncbi:hypothetical protein ACFQ3T_30835 [Saccharothrix hoggarensis]|uniref:Uncharacterized protein n=1 Tax=Saccharothrix hoggarensis TaxID=913853 RepID=A0ABW3R3S8_9PSEU